jgi:glycosyltransferase involved in cell wall biosynthesis
VLDGYSRQTVDPDRFEVLVVADCMDSNPEAVDEAIGQRDYRTRRLTGRIPGLSSNRNTGWRAAESPIVLFTDNDTIPVPEFLAEHLDWHRRNPEEEVAVVGHIRWAPELKLTPFMRWLDEGVQFDLGSIEGEEASWAHLYGANSSIKRSLVEKVGGYDEERLPYLYEDLDFGYRAREHGLRVLYNRRAIVDHVRPGMTVEFWKEKVHRLAASERAFVAIHPEMEPWFYNLFSAAAKRPQVRGRGAKLAPYVPEWVPWLGPRVWESVRKTYWQELAPAFLEAWEKSATRPMTAEWLAASSDGGRAQSAASTGSGSERSRGSQPGGS